MARKRPLLDQPLHVGGPNITDPESFMTMVEEILRRSWFTNNGPLVQELEDRLAEFLGVRNCVAMANGTVALEIASRALRLTGEVIVPAFTFVATAHALRWQGLMPVFADIDPVTHCLDPESVRARITADTTGIVGVHLWGGPAPVEALTRLADDRDLVLMFDAAHAFGSTLGGRMIGGFGRAEVFSFHATKFFTTMEGGAVATDDDALAEEMRLMRNFGFAGMDRVIHLGVNGKMTEVCAAMGLANLVHVPHLIEVNTANHAAYAEVFARRSEVRLLTPPRSGGQTNHQYVVVELLGEAGPHRDRVLRELRENNVLARRYFYPGAHRMAPYDHEQPGASDHLPITEDVASRVLVLPTGTSVDPSTARAVANLLLESLDSARPVTHHPPDGA